MYGGYIPTKKDVFDEINIEEPKRPGQVIADAGVNHASDFLRGRKTDTIHPDGSKTSVCARCAGNIIAKAGLPIPVDKYGEPVTSAGNFFDQLTGHPYAQKNYDTAWMRSGEWKNWMVIDKKENIMPGDVLLFKGSGYQQMIEGNPTETNPSGYHIAISTTEWHEPWGSFTGVSGGISLVDDQGAESVVRHRNKYAASVEQDFVKAARYIGQ